MGSQSLRLTGAVAIAAAMYGQSFQRRASIAGRVGEHGKCTIEVVVDTAAEVEIRGDTATLRTLAGRPAEWRRFECNAPMPPNPAEFRFSGVDGRGRQTLVRDPGDGGPAVIRIEDPQGGTEGYTFDITWRAAGPPINPGFDRGDRDRDLNRRPFSADQAVQVCREAVREQATQRFRTPDIRFLTIRMDDNPGRNDWVMGLLSVHRGFNREEEYRFSCSVDFESGRVRSAEIEPQPGRGGVEQAPPRGAFGPDRVIEECRRAVDDRIRSEGYDRARFENLRIDERPGRNDRVSGTARAESRWGPGTFDFSCRIDPQSGVIRSVDAILR